MEKVEQQKSWQKVWAWLVVGLTVLFFGVCYFGIVTSGEDIHQGANQPAAVWEDMTAAFRHNGRLPDMYAWAVINFFDYQYSFGVDTVFRLVDVVLGVGMIYMMVRIALGERVKLNLRTALLWGLAFCAIFLTPHGRVLYAGFSAIHNYLLIAVITLGFGLMYLQSRGQKCWLSPVMLMFGVVFGLSSNLTPIVFLLTAGIWLIAKMVREKKIMAVLQRVKIWQWLGAIGILLGMAVAYIGGPGVSGYLDSGYTAEYDYVSISDVLNNPVESVVKLAKHCVSNFGRVLLPLAIIVALVAGLKMLGKQRGAWKLSEQSRKTVTLLLIFMVMHVAIAVQLAAPIRILLPAYLAGVVVTLVLAKEWLTGWKVNVALAGVTVVTLAIVVVRTVLAVDYYRKAGQVLQKIEQYDALDVVCVTPEEVRSRVLPVIYLGQEDMLADWAMPEWIYEKEVVWCE